MIVLLKLGNHFLRLVDFDSDTIYSKYPLADNSKLYEEYRSSNGEVTDSAFDFYITPIKDLILLCHEVTLINPVQIAYRGLKFEPINQQHPIMEMRTFEANLLYQLALQWPEHEILDADYKWHSCIEVEEHSDKIEIREIEKKLIGQGRDFEYGDQLHSLLIFYSGKIRLDNKPLTPEQFNRVNRVFSLIGYKFYPE